MNDFFVCDGLMVNLVDIIIKNKIKGDIVEISSFGANRHHLDRLNREFSRVTLVSRFHDKMNREDFKYIKELEKKYDGFIFVNRRTHAKIVRIDRGKVILTSANLASNKNIEFYSIFSDITKEMNKTLDEYFGEYSEKKNKNNIKQSLVGFI